MNSNADHRSLFALVTTLIFTNAAVALTVLQYGLLG
jgi:hypothetical protein